jgi:hypothetical protein
MSYNINPFKGAVLCDVSPLEVCDVILGQPYMWKCHVVYESRPHSVIATLGGQLYMVPEVVLTTVPPKQCRKVVSQMKKFSFYMIRSKGKQKDTATTVALAQDLSIHQKQIDKIVEEHKYILIAPTGVPPHYPIKKIYNRALHTLHATSSPTESPHTHADHPIKLLGWNQPLQQQVLEIWLQQK